jgi:UDP-N-acetylglucosamine--N-acetylmuramyl-(pentapeptide) pyrophosphoryl-undecaprenol N-acetylglucosamine transferase
MTNSKKTQSVVFVGGLTGGPVTPLLAVATEWCKQDLNIAPTFIDLKKSVASRLVPRAGFKFQTIITGKLRRYWTIKNLLTPFLLLIGLIQSLIILVRLRPIAVVGAGGYVQVPVMYAAWLLKTPRFIHQQDIVPTLANKLVAPIASQITTTFQKSVKDFSQGLGFSKNYAQYNKVVWTGNPSIVTSTPKSEAQKIFKLDPDWPTVLVNGGGSGAIGLNQALIHNLQELIKVAQVMHSTGVGKKIKPPIDLPAVHDRYHQYEYIEHMDEALIAADIVITRAGIGTITGLSDYGKISIIIPMPNSHQEANAQYLYDHFAAIVLDQMEITPDTFAKVVRKLLFDVKLQKELQKNISAIIPKDATRNVLKVILDFLNAR